MASGGAGRKPRRRGPERIYYEPQTVLRAQRRGGGRISESRLKSFQVIRSAGFVACATIVLANLVLLAAPAWNPFTDLRDPDRLLWFTKIEQVLAHAPELQAADVLILGDSQTMSGVVPEVLDGQLGTRSLNLGMPSQQPEGLLTLAKRLPDARARSRRVILNINPFSLFQTEVMQSFTYYYRAELARYESSGPGYTRAGPGGWLHQWLLRLPLYEANYILAPVVGIGEAGLSEFTFAQIRARPDLLLARTYESYLSGADADLLEILDQRREQSRRLRALLELHGGFWTWKDSGSPQFDPGVCHKSEARPDLDLAYRGEPGSYVYPERPAAIAAYRDLLELLGRKGYEVWLIEIPFSPAYGNFVNTAGVYQAVDRTVAEILKGLSRPESIRIVSFPKPLAEASAGAARLRQARYFHDLTHLSACGASYYTRWLAAELVRNGF